MQSSLRQKLVGMALDARDQAYAAYSNYKVGAVNQTAAAEIFTGDWPDHWSA